MAQPVKVFYCYASADEKALNKLHQQLKVLEHQGLIETWYKRQILPGTNYTREIEARIHQAQVIIVLISPTFLASEYYDGKEMELALQLHRAGKACVIPVLLDSSLWQFTPLKDLQPLPANSKPIREWGSREATAWLNVALGIHTLATSMQTLAEQAVEIVEPAPNGTKPAGKARQPARAKRASASRRPPIADAEATIQSPHRARKVHVSAPLQSTPIEYEPIVIEEEEPEPATPKARQATPDYDQFYDNLQDKINGVHLKILVWEPDMPTQGLVAEKRRAIFHALTAEEHQCRLGKTLLVPANASLQDSEIEEARKSDTTILLFEPPAHGEMTEFCKHEDIVERTLIFYPRELKSDSSHLTLDKKIHIRFHLQYYQEQDILNDHILTEVLNWVMAHRSFRYSNRA